MRMKLVWWLAAVFTAPILPAKAETVTLPHGLSITLPEGWRVNGPSEGRVSGSGGLRRIQLVCENEACKQTQETCTILMRDGKDAEGADDAARLRALYASPLDRYFRLRAVLRSTSKDAEIRKPLEITRLGGREWYRVETDARHNRKSGFFAETVVDGRYVGGICKTCETGEVRHRDGEAILSGLTSGTVRAATLR
ncbi:hypothetical protein [Bosea sp. (in: a-proteobacteria)]|uniref:hypothetical protein n=1 Tax=Bosea sp. (in: a-proteobacteria) TaxID=1871050 RepID=UPI00260AB9F4|nr:hypothetical protein [Bosea sp. (in: a-proteobacteria)]MCO5092456.1 hypothetical protein [Bosea sp. (in: a-proteobacteria)]